MRRLIRFLLALLSVAVVLAILYVRGPGFGIDPLSTWIAPPAGVEDQQATLDDAEAGAQSDDDDGGDRVERDATRGADVGADGVSDLSGGVLGLSFSVASSARQPITSTVDGNALTVVARVENRSGVEYRGTVLIELPPLGAGRQADCSIRVAANDFATCSVPVVTDGWAWHENGRRESTVALEATTIGRLGGDPAREQARIVVAVATRPVVLVHGFISNAGTWSAWAESGGFLARAGLAGFAVGDPRFAIEPMSTGDAAQPRAGGNTIAQNAAILGRTIDAVRAETGAERVDVVAHSMGGLIARRYIAGEMEVLARAPLADAPVVAQLHLIGTPNGGSHCTVPLAAIGALLPMSAEMTPHSVRDVFNPTAADARGVPFFVWAGDPVRDYAALICTPLPTDAFVSVASVADSLPDTVPYVLERIAQRHLAQTQSTTVFESVLKQLSRAPTAYPIVMPKRPLELDGVRLAAHEDMQVAMAPAAGSGSSTRIEVGPFDQASFALFGAESPFGGQAAVAEPVGAVSSPDGSASAPDSTKDDEDDDEQRRAPASLSGTWEVGLPTQGAPTWVAAAFLDSALRLTIDDAPLDAAADGSIAVTASLEGSVDGEATSVRVRLLATDGSVAAETLLERPTGLAGLASNDEYTGAFQAPSSPGAYAMIVQAEGRTDAGEPFTRVVVRALTVR